MTMRTNLKCLQQEDNPMEGLEGQLLLLPLLLLSNRKLDGNMNYADPIEKDFCLQQFLI